MGYALGSWGGQGGCHAGEIHLTCDEGTQDGGGTMSLYRWLIADPELRGLARVSTAPVPSGEGHMGGATEIVNVVLGNTIALTNLLVAVAAWRDSRPRSPQVRLERDGESITVSEASPETVERILRTWERGRGGEPDAEDAVDADREESE